MIEILRRLEAVERELERRRVEVASPSQANTAAAATDVTTTSTSFVDMDSMAVTLTTRGGDLLVWFSAGFYHVTVGTIITLGVKIDAEADVTLIPWNQGAANMVEPMARQYRFTPVAAGSHTVKMRWKTSAGTLHVVERAMLVQELGR